MAEGLTKKKRIRAGHKASASRMLRQIEELLAADTQAHTSRLSQLKLSLQEKLDTLKILDGEILDLVEDDALVEEIKQADSFKEGIYAAMISIEKHCTAPTVVLPTATPTTSTIGLEPGTTSDQHTLHEALV